MFMGGIWVNLMGSFMENKNNGPQLCKLVLFNLQSFLNPQFWAQYLEQSKEIQ